MTYAEKLETFRLNCPLDNKYIKTKTTLEGEVLGLEIYTPPILSYSHLNVFRKYISRMKLNLKAVRVNAETIEITNKTNQL